MHFEDGQEVRFTLRGEDLHVRLEGRRWHLRWRDRTVECEHIDRAVAALLQEHMSAVMPLVARLLRAEPGATLD